jgi:hypothetical protein
VVIDHTNRAAEVAIAEEAEELREAIWDRAMQAGWTVERIAKATGLSVRQVSRRLKRARESRQESASSPSAEIPRLLLSSSSRPRECHHGRTSTDDVGVLYCLDCDGISTDGGRNWLAAQSHHTPSLAVLAPSGTGRGERIQRLTGGRKSEPGGPTSHKPDPRGLSGGRGRCSSRGRSSRSSPGSQ